MTYRKAGGTQTISLCFARPVVIASATSSGVDDSGVGSIPAVIFECTKPDRTTMTRAPHPARLEPRLRKNESMAALDEPYTKFARRTRSAETVDNTTRVPWPCARN